MPKYKLLNNIIGWLVFFVATATYFSTIEGTASFWDCGEYIACSHKLEVGHPPGAPFFLLIARFFIWIGGDDPTNAAKWVNRMSALCSSFSILFLFWTITMLAKKMVFIAKQEFTLGRQMAVLASGIIGALAYTFSDSFWFSAVEGEVYAMSSLFTASVFWAIFKWEEEAEKPYSVRWLILIAYLVGLSIGVHLLNLLVIPAICFIFYFKKYKFTIPSFLLTCIVSVILLGGIEGVMIPKIVKFSADYELFFTNVIGSSYNVGTIVYFTLLLSSVILGIVYSIKRSEKLYLAFALTGGLFVLLTLVCGAKFNSSGSTFLRLIVLGGFLAGLLVLKNKPAVLHHIMVSFALILMGYSTFLVLVIRSKANTPMDENNPENAISLLSYLNREQYGDWPILKGQYYNAELDASQPYFDGDPIYGKGTEVVFNKKTLKTDTVEKYVVVDDRKKSIPNYDQRFVTVFPRMWSQQGGHESSYKVWGQVKGKPSGKTDDNGEPIMIPTFGENLRFFKNYQLGYMFWRYFGWNFIGKQNDIQGLTNNITEGNVISGINFIDKVITGVDQSIMPYATKNNKGTNKFYFLPLILGLIGLVFQLVRHTKDFFVCLLLFFFTGIAIVIFLNQYPFQPRERDYAYAASFYVFAIWIGLGVYAIAEMINSLLDRNETNSTQEEKSALDKFRWGTAIFSLTLSSCVPYLMAKNGYDDHDRSKTSVARDFAINYLQSCEKGAILFTNGDNDTFPLWYAQEVEGIRTDVRVINLSLLQTDWYINQCRRAAYDSPPVPFTMNEKSYEGSKREVVYFRDEDSGYMDVDDIMRFVESTDINKKIPYDGRYLDYIPSQKLRVPVYKNASDSIKILKTPGLVPKGMENRIIRNLDWEVKKQYVTKNDLMIIDLLAGFKWKRPIYFAVTTGPESYLALQNYFQLEGLAYRLSPIKSTQAEMTHGTRINTEKMYNNIMNKFLFGGMKTKGSYNNENSLRMAANMRIQMTSLASVLIEEGKKEKAKKILDKMMIEMPEENIPYDATLYTAVLCRYQLNQNKEANELAQKLFSVFESDMNFYLGLRMQQQVSYQREMEQCQAIMSRMSSIAKTYNEPELAKNFMARYMAFPFEEEQQQPQSRQSEMKLQAPNQ
jgi:hypothetical protein